MMQEEEPSEEQKEIWHNDPSNWIWGFIYYNQRDRRIFVPKRNKWLGITLNFANPKAIIFIVGIMLLVAATAFLANRS